MSVKSRILVSVLVILCAWTTGAKAEEQTEDVVLLVVPARPTIVQYAFDIAAMRSTVLVSYQRAAGSSSPVLHIWDKTVQDWVKTNIEEYGAGASFPKTPKRAIVIGNDQTLVSKLVEAAAWVGNVKSIPTLNLMDLTNALNEDLRFSPGEWKWLAKMHGLQLKDLNEERRHYGRYGKPGEKRTPPMPRSESDVVEKKLAPVPVKPEVKAPDVEPLKKGPAPKKLRDLPPEDK